MFTKEALSTGEYGGKLFKHMVGLDTDIKIHADTHTHILYWLAP